MVLHCQALVFHGFRFSVYGFRAVSTGFVSGSSGSGIPGSSYMSSTAT